MLQLKVCPYEGFRLRGDNGVAIAAQSSHTGGRPISQRESAGFNRPPEAVAAVNPVSISPETVQRYGSARCSSSLSLYFPAHPLRISMTPPTWSLADGLRHPVQSLPDVRGTEARSAGIDRPNGVTNSFHVRTYKVAPRTSVTARNLLAKDRVRSALMDEMAERGP